MFNRENLIENSTSSYNVLTSLLDNIIKDIDTNLKNNKYGIDLNNSYYKKILDNDSTDILISLLEKHYNMKGYFTLDNSRLIFYSIPYKLSLDEISSNSGMFIRDILNHCLIESKKGNFNSKFIFSISRFLKKDGIENKKSILDYFNDLSLKAEVHIKSHFNLDSEYILDEDNKCIKVEINWK